MKMIHYFDIIIRHHQRLVFLMTPYPLLIAPSPLILILTLIWIRIRRMEGRLRADFNLPSRGTSMRDGVEWNRMWRDWAMMEQDPKEVSLMVSWAYPLSRRKPREGLGTRREVATAAAARWNRLRYHVWHVSNVLNVCHASQVLVCYYLHDFLLPMQSKPPSSSPSPPPPPSLPYTSASVPCNLEKLASYLLGRPAKRPVLFIRSCSTQILELRHKFVAFVSYTKGKAFKQIHFNFCVNLREWRPFQWKYGVFMQQHGAKNSKYRKKNAFHFVSRCKSGVYTKYQSIY